MQNSSAQPFTLRYFRIGIPWPIRIAVLSLWKHENIFSRKNSWGKFVFHSLEFRPTRYENNWRIFNTSRIINRWNNALTTTNTYKVKGDLCCIFQVWTKWENIRIRIKGFQVHYLRRKVQWLLKIVRWLHKISQIRPGFWRPIVQQSNSRFYKFPNNNE